MGLNQTLLRLALTAILPWQCLYASVWRLRPPIFKWPSTSSNGSLSLGNWSCVNYNDLFIIAYPNSLLRNLLAIYSLIHYFKRES